MDFVITIGLSKGVNKILFQHRDTSTFLGLSCARVSPHRFLGNEPSSDGTPVYGSLGVTAFLCSHELPRLSRLLAATGRETDQTDAIRLLKLRLPRYSPKPSFCLAVVGVSPLALGGCPEFCVLSHDSDPRRISWHDEANRRLTMN